VEHRVSNVRRAVAVARCCTRIRILHANFHAFRAGRLLMGWVSTTISLLSPALYFLSRIVMMGQVVAALRAEHPAIYETYVALIYWIHLL
jgi:hypothetical protein